MKTIEITALEDVTGGSYMNNLMLRQQIQTINSTIRAQSQSHWGSSNQLAMAIAIGSMLRR